MVYSSISDYTLLPGSSLLVKTKSGEFEKVYLLFVIGAIPHKHRIVCEHAGRTCNQSRPISKLLYGFLIHACERFPIDSIAHIENPTSTFIQLDATRQDTSTRPLRALLFDPNTSRHCPQQCILLITLRTSELHRGRLWHSKHEMEPAKTEKGATLGLIEYAGGKRFLFF